LGNGCQLPARAEETSRLMRSEERPLT
jgi:hypothetical protein